jgi:hypothetical protein
VAPRRVAAVTGQHRGRAVLRVLGLGGAVFVLCAGMVVFGLYLIGVF